MLSFLGSPHGGTMIILYSVRAPDLLRCAPQGPPLGLEFDNSMPFGSLAAHGLCIWLLLTMAVQVLLSGLTLVTTANIQLQDDIIIKI